MRRWVLQIIWNIPHNTGNHSGEVSSHCRWHYFLQCLCFHYHKLSPPTDRLQCHSHTFASSSLVPFQQWQPLIPQTGLSPLLQTNHTQKGCMAVLDTISESPSCSFLLRSLWYHSFCPVAAIYCRTPLQVTSTRDECQLTFLERGRHLRIIRKVQAALPVINVSKLRINLHFSYRECYHFYILLL